MFARLKKYWRQSFTGIRETSDGDGGTPDSERKKSLETKTAAAQLPPAPMDQIRAQSLVRVQQPVTTFRPITHWCGPLVSSLEAERAGFTDIALPGFFKRATNKTIHEFLDRQN